MCPSSLRQITCREQDAPDIVYTLIHILVSQLLPDFLCDFLPGNQALDLPLRRPVFRLLNKDAHGIVSARVHPEILRLRLRICPQNIAVI